MIKRYDFCNFVSVNKYGYLLKINVNYSVAKEIQFPSEWPYGVCQEARDLANKEATHSSATAEDILKGFFSLTAEEMITKVISDYNK